MFRKVKTVEEFKFFTSNPFHLSPRSFSDPVDLLKFTMMRYLFPIMVDEAESLERISKAAKEILREIGRYQVQSGIFITPGACSYENKGKDRAMARYIGQLIKELEEARDKIKGLERIIAFSDANCEERGKQYDSCRVSNDL